MTSSGHKTSAVLQGWRKRWSPHCREPAREVFPCADFAPFSHYDQPGVKPGHPLPFTLLPWPIRSSHPELALPGGTLTLCAMGAHVGAVTASPFQTTSRPYPAPKCAKGAAQGEHPSLWGGFQEKLDACPGGKMPLRSPQTQPQTCNSSSPHPRGR